MPSWTSLRQQKSNGKGLIRAGPKRPPSELPRMEPYIELRPVMTIKTEALVAPLECSVPTIQDIQRIESFFFTYHKLDLRILKFLKTKIIFKNTEGESVKFYDKLCCRRYLLKKQLKKNIKNL